MLMTVDIETLRDRYGEALAREQMTAMFLDAPDATPAERAKLTTAYVKVVAELDRLIDAIEEAGEPMTETEVLHGFTAAPVPF